GEESGRSAVEIGDRGLHLGEALFFAGALVRDLVDLPDGERAFAARARIRRHGLHRDAEPARDDGGVLLALTRRRQAELLLQGAALLRRAGKAEDRLGEMRVAAEGAIRRRHRRFGIETEQRAVGRVGIKHAAPAIGDQRALREIVGERLGYFVAVVALTEMDNADGAREHTEHADYGKAGDDR